MAKGDAGGSAMSGGSEYQSRGGAYFLVHMLLKRDLSSMFGLNETFIIDTIQYEAKAYVDDLILNSNNHTVFCQFKRSISLSESESSDFYKTLQQFINQFVSNVEEKATFALITSTRGSSKIRLTLKKYVESAILDELNFEKLPYNEIELDTIRMFKRIVGKILSDNIGPNYHPTLYVKFLKKIKIISMDLEEGESVEREVYSILLNKTKLPEKFLWRDLISFSLSMSKDRKSVNFNGATSRFKHFLVDDQSVTKDNESVFFKIEFMNSLRSGKEVFLVQHREDLLMITSKRFNDSGGKQWRILKNKCVNSVGAEYDLIFRASSEERVLSYLEENHEKFNTKKLFLVSSQFDFSGYELVNHVYNYTMLCNQKLTELEKPNKCICCDLAIGERNAYIIEIDDEERGHDVGLIHKKCHDPRDRVLGVTVLQFFDENYPMDSFDIEEWVQLLKKSTLRILEAKNTLNEVKMTPIVLWNPEFDYANNGSHCIKMNLEKNVIVYAKERGRILRGSQKEIEKKCALMNAPKGASNENPLCFLFPSLNYGTKKELLALNDSNEECLSVLSCESVLCTKDIVEKNNSDLFYYAPLLYLEHKDTQEKLMLNEHIALFTDPSEFGYYVENYLEALSLDLREFKVMTIKDDATFDLMGLRNQVQYPFLVDATFENAERGVRLISGIKVQNMNYLVEK